MRASHRLVASPTVREQAAALYQQHLDRYIIERAAPFTSGGAPSTGNEAVSSFLDALAKLYHVRHWTTASFERAFLMGAVPGWRPGASVHKTTDGYRVVSPICPIGALAEVDKDACRACRTFQEAVARQALPERARFITFHGLIAEGDATCDATIRTREGA